MRRWGERTQEAGQGQAWYLRTVISLTGTQEVESTYLDKSNHENHFYTKQDLRI